MSLLPEDNLLANVRHVDVALVITRGCAAPSEGQINERGTERREAGRLMQTVKWRFLHFKDLVG